MYFILNLLTGWGIKKYIQKGGGWDLCWTDDAKQSMKNVVESSLTTVAKLLLSLQ
jgi:hypothetical protein